MSVSRLIDCTSLITSTPNSAPISDAVSKSIEVFTPQMILFINIFLTSSGRGIPIFSENSLTVIDVPMRIVDFLTKASDILCSFSFLGCATRGSTFLLPLLFDHCSNTLNCLLPEYIGLDCAYHQVLYVDLHHVLVHHDC